MHATKMIADIRLHHAAPPAPRLDQMEDSMALAQQAAVHASEMQAAQQGLKATDAAYIGWARERFSFVGVVLCQRRPN